MKERVFGHPLTSLLGTLIILSCIAGFFLKMMDWPGALSGLGLGALFLGLKDPGNGSNNTPAALILLALSIGLQSCVTYSKCEEKFGQLTKDTVKVQVKVPVTVTVPPDSLEWAQWADSLKNLAPGDTVYIKDTVSRISVRYWRDLYTNLIHYRADYKSAPVHDTLRVQVPCPPPVIFQDKPSKGEAAKAKEPGRVQGLLNEFENVLKRLFWLLIIAFALGILYRLIK